MRDGTTTSMSNELIIKVLVVATGHSIELPASLLAIEDPRKDLVLQGFEELHVKSVEGEVVWGSWGRGLLRPLADFRSGDLVLLSSISDTSGSNLPTPGTWPIARII